MKLDEVALEQAFRTFVASWPWLRAQWEKAQQEALQRAGSLELPSQPFEAAVKEYLRSASPVRPPVIVSLDRDGGVAIEPEDAEVEKALARLLSLVDRELLVLLSYHVEAMAMEKAHGSLDATLNMNAGRVQSADFDRRTHWQRKKDGSPNSSC